MYKYSNCLNTSTRSRILFDSRGVYNSNQWAKEKKNINWSKRQNLLKNFFKNNKKKNIDSIIPVSRGTDGRQNGFDYTMFDKTPKQFIKPIIFLDRSENYSHFVKALQKNIIHSVTTANSLNFAGNDLQEARELVGN